MYGDDSFHNMNERERDIEMGGNIPPKVAAFYFYIWRCSLQLALPNLQDGAKVSQEHQEEALMQIHHPVIKTCLEH